MLRYIFSFIDGSEYSCIEFYYTTIEMPDAFITQ
jgi:hypothetical protein